MKNEWVIIFLITVISTLPAFVISTLPAFVISNEERNLHTPNEIPHSAYEEFKMTFEGGPDIFNPPPAFDNPASGAH